MSREKGAEEGIEMRFIREFLARILKARAEKINSGKTKIILSNLPSTGPVVSKVISIEEKTTTPALMKSIVSESAPSAEQKSTEQRVLLASPQRQLVKRPIANYIKPFNLQRMSAGNNPPTPRGISFSIEKLNNILLDPLISMIECPGADKPIIATRGGISSVSKIILTEEEINNFMKDISQRTRIPVITGLFKALVGNFMITAVVSDFIGTRFVIQRRRY